MSICIHAKYPLIIYTGILLLTYTVAQCNVLKAVYKQHTSVGLVQYCILILPAIKGHFILYIFIYNYMLSVYHIQCA